MLTIWIIVFIACLYVLAKSADYFTDSAARIGTLLKLPQFITGVLIVSIGTATPELFSSIFGLIDGDPNILVGNVLGTVIVNILLGMGLAAVVFKKTIKFHWDNVSNDMPFLFGAVVLLALTIYDGKFKLIEGIIFLLAYGIFVVYSIRIKKMNRKEIRDDLRKEIKTKFREDFKKFDEKKTPKSNLKVVATFIVSLFFILISAKYLVDSLIAIATLLNLATAALSASIIAIGTSLPEISVAITSARKGNFDLSIGNLMGASIFDILVIFGISGIILPFTISSSILTLILPMVFATVIIQWLITLDRKITYSEGLLMILIYFVFIGKLFGIF